MRPWLVILCGLAAVGSACAPPRGRQLCDAIGKRNVVEVRRLLAGSALDGTRNYGTCVPADVFSTAKREDRDLNDIAVALLSSGLPPDASWFPPGRSETVTAIGAAARNGNDTLVRALLAVGLDVKHTETVRAFVQAAEAGHLPVVRMLVQEGIDLEATSGGETALDRARAANHEEVVQFLEETLAARAPKKPEDAEPKS